jgi:cytosine/creatinine deaminase
MDDERFMEQALTMARQGYAGGGIPIGSILVRGSEIIGRGHNQRIQEGDPILHGEMDCLRNAGRQKSYRATCLYTTLSPCMMCAGTIAQFKIRRVVIGENRNFGGNEQFLRDQGVDVVVMNNDECYKLMKEFILSRPGDWNEDIASDE